MRQSIVTWCAAALLLCAGAGRGETAYTSALDYIEQTGTLWGIAGCLMNPDGSITLVDRTQSGAGFLLWIAAKDGAAAEQVTLRQGESCQLTDGHHAFITYAFLGLQDDRIRIEVTDTFNAISFGGTVEERRDTVTIEPYADAAGSGGSHRGDS